MHSSVVEILYHPLSQKMESYLKSFTKIPGVAYNFKEEYFTGSCGNDKSRYKFKNETLSITHICETNRPLPGLDFELDGSNYLSKR